MTDKATIVAQVAALEDMDLPALRERWTALFDTPVPGYGKVMMRKRLAYRIQELAYGGLSEAVKQKLREVHRRAEERKMHERHSPHLPVIGSVLVRDYDGVRNEVKILSNGFDYAGKRWKSLSAIANHITGTRWNGHAFFGLRSQRKVSA